jgi:hypothetical protein
MVINSETSGFFDRNSQVLRTFANEHNLLIEEFWHEIPSWRFSFRHPDGGVGCVELLLEKRELPEIRAYYWNDDYETGVRNLKSFSTDVLAVSEISAQLEETFQMVIGWDQNSLDDKVGGFHESWHRAFSIEEFNRFNEKYPIPVP